MTITLEDLSGMDIGEIRAAINEIVAELRDLHIEASGELRDLRHGDQVEFDRLTRLHDRAKAHLAIREAAGGRSHERAFSTGPRRSHDSLSGSDPAAVVRMGRAEARDSALRALEFRGRRLEPDQQDQVDGLLRSVISDDNPNVDGSYIAKRILITESDDYRSAWQQLVTQAHPLLTNPEIEAVRAFQELEREYRAMSEGVTTAGGFGVPTFIDASVIMTAQGSDNPFMQMAKVVPVTTNLWKGVSSAGVTWSFDAEAAEVSDDSPVLAQPSVTVHMARGFIPFSIEVGQDYPAFADEMATLLAEGYDDLLLDKLTRGTGSGEPRGILTALSANTNVRVTLTTSGAFGSPDPYKVWKALPQRFRRRAQWLMSVDVNNKVRQLGSADQLHALNAQLPTDWLDTMFGKEVYESPYMPDTTTSTSATNGLAVVGNFKNFVIARRAGMSVELVQHLIGLTANRPTGSRGWFAWTRLGADSVNDVGFRLLVNT